MATIFIPSRSVRRRLAGQDCPMCGLVLHHKDLAMVVTDSHSVPLHQACTRYLLEQAQQEAEASE